MSFCCDSTHLKSRYIPLNRNAEYSWKDLYVAQISWKAGCSTSLVVAPTAGGWATLAPTAGGWMASPPLLQFCDTSWLRNLRIKPKMSVITFITAFAFLFSKHLDVREKETMLNHQNQRFRTILYNQKVSKLYSSRWLTHKTKS